MNQDSDDLFGRIARDLGIPCVAQSTGPMHAHVLFHPDFGAPRRFGGPRRLDAIPNVQWNARLSIELCSDGACT